MAESSPDPRPNLTPGLTIELVPTPTKDMRELVDALDASISAHYLPEQRHGLSLEALFQPNVRFFLAWSDAVAVGCCGVALFDGYAELKRMFVQDGVRGRGVARALLARVEAETRGAGLAWLRLETGDRQHAAMRLYARQGFRRRAPFGAYAAMTVAAIQRSVFLEKPIAIG